MGRSRRQFHRIVGYAGVAGAAFFLFRFLRVVFLNPCNLPFGAGSEYGWFPVKLMHWGAVGGGTCLQWSLLYPLRNLAFLGICLATPLLVMAIDRWWIQRQRRRAARR